jgi:hypothetical protein
LRGGNSSRQLFVDQWFWIACVVDRVLTLLVVLRDVRAPMRRVLDNTVRCVAHDHHGLFKLADFRLLFAEFLWTLRRLLGFQLILPGHGERVVAHVASLEKGISVYKLGWARWTFVLIAESVFFLVLRLSNISRDITCILILVWHDIATLEESLGRLYLFLHDFGGLDHPFEEFFFGLGVAAWQKLLARA